MRAAAERLRRQRDAMVAFGGLALRSDDLDALLQEAARQVSEGLDVAMVKVLEMLPGGDELLIRAGVGWRAGVVGHAVLSAHTDSPAGYALQQDEAVTSPDTAQETRFQIPDLLREHGIRSMTNVVIPGERGPWGVLEVDAPRRRAFDEEDTAFLTSYANLLGAAVERLHAHREAADAADKQRLLVRELQHRVSNLLANIRAMAQRTRANSDSLEAFAAAFDERLAALARTQALLTSTPDGARLRDLLLQELDAHGVQPGPRVRIDCDETELSADTAQSLALAFHELATNAVKHGALAVDGCMSVNCSREAAGGEAELVVRWRERGVRTADPPARRGFGLEVIEQAVPYLMGGKTELAFEPDGIACTIRVPLDGAEPA